MKAERKKEQRMSEMHNRLVVRQDSFKYIVPKLGGNAIASFEILVVMSQMVLFHLGKVE